MRNSRFGGTLGATGVLLGVICFNISHTRGDVPATVTAPASSPPVDSGFDPSQYLTGDWFSLRRQLYDHGVSIEPFLLFDYSKNFLGGLNTRSDSFRQRFDVPVTIDTEKLLGWHGGTFQIAYQMQHGDNASHTLVGDAQNFSFGTDADGRSQLGKLWYEQKLFDDNLRIRVGKQDGNADFDALQNDVDFLNNSFSTSPTLYLMPSFPDNGMGIEAFYEPKSGFYAGVAVFDGSIAHGVELGEYGPRHFFDCPNNLFLIAETGQSFKLPISGRHLPGRIGLGGWYSTDHIDRLDGHGQKEGTGGVYLILDQLLWKPFREKPVVVGLPGGNLANAPEVEENYPGGIASSFSAAWADPAVNRIDGNVLLSLEWTGILPSRRIDALGLGASYAHFSTEADLHDDYELAIETFYLIRFTPAVSLRPDLQFIIHPSGSGASDESPIQNALVFTMRLQVAF